MQMRSNGMKDCPVKGFINSIWGLVGKNQNPYKKEGFKEWKQYQISPKTEVRSRKLDFGLRTPDFRLPTSHSGLIRYWKDYRKYYSYSKYSLILLLLKTKTPNQYINPCLPTVRWVLLHNLQISHYLNCRSGKSQYHKRS